MSVQCADCKAILENPVYAEGPPRDPCPFCGSTVRTYTMTAERAEFSITAGPATLTHASPSVAPAITLQAILQFGEKNHEGQLVEDVALPWYEMLDVIRRDPGRAHEIGARKWEEIIAGAYKRAGYDEVILTPRSGDRGRDIIASKRGVGCIRIVDQMKAYRPDHVVTADEVRAMVGVLTCEDNVSKGVVTTTSTFAPKIREELGLQKLMPYRLELKPRDVLLPWLDDVAKKRKKSR